MTTATLPTTPAETTPEWLTGALRGTGAIGPGTRITAITSELVGEGAGFIGLVARLGLTYAGDTAGAPGTLIAKFPAPDPGSRQVGNLYGLYEREVRFYNGLAGDCGLEVPRCYFAAYDADAGQSLVLIEDLDGLGRFGDQVTGCTPDEARLAVHSLARFQARWWQHPRLETFPWMPTADALVRNAMLTAYEQCWGLYAERYGHLLTPGFSAAGLTLHRRILAHLDRFASNPLTICHGDFRPDNMFFGNATSGRPLIVFDWQSPNRGWGAYDLAYFIAGSLETDLRRRHEDDLLAEYHGLLMEGGVTGYPLEQLRNDYRACMAVMTGISIINGATLPMTNQRALDLFVQMFERFVAAIEDQDVLSVLATG